MEITREILIQKGFEEKRLGNLGYQYTYGKVCIEFHGLGKGRFLFYYIMNRNYISKEIKTEKELDFLISFFNS